MAKTTPKSPFSVVSPLVPRAISAAEVKLQDSNGPPRPLGVHGLQLWQEIQAQYAISDAGGTELLLQAAEACDTIAALAEEIAKDGAVIRGKTGPRSHPALRDQLGARAFVVRALVKLGVNVAVTPPRPSPGRPPKW
jgi:hypothetical protein